MNESDQEADDEIARRVETLAADLDRARTDYEAILIHLSRLSATETDATKRRAMETVATVIATDYELKVLLLKALAEPEDREIWLKYLALVCHAALEELPPRVGADFKDAGRSFKDALRPIRDDADFVQNLATIRNKVAAHRDVVNGDHWLAQWHLSQISDKHNGTTVLRSKIVKHSGTMLGALKALGVALLSEYPDLLPRRQ